MLVENTRSLTLCFPGLTHSSLSTGSPNGGNLTDSSSLSITYPHSQRSSPGRNWSENPSVTRPYNVQSPSGSLCPSVISQVAADPPKYLTTTFESPPLPSWEYRPYLLNAASISLVISFKVSPPCLTGFADPSA